jgi:hypothetical protein
VTVSEQRLPDALGESALTDHRQHRIDQPPVIVDRGMLEVTARFRVDLDFGVKPSGK